MQPNKTSKNVLIRYPWNKESTPENLKLIRNRFRLQKNPALIKDLWDFWYGYEDRCHHVAQPCKKEEKEGYCDHNRRLRRYNIVHGQLLNVWGELMDLALHSAGRGEDPDAGCASVVLRLLGPSQW